MNISFNVYNLQFIKFTTAMKIITVCKNRTWYWICIVTDHCVSFLSLIQRMDSRHCFDLSSLSSRKWNNKMKIKINEKLKRIERKKKFCENKKKKVNMCLNLGENLFLFCLYILRDQSITTYTKVRNIFYFFFILSTIFLKLSTKKFFYLGNFTFLLLSGTTHVAKLWIIFS